MSMTPEAKIWTILQKIDDAITIAPSGEPVSLDAKELEKSIAREEHEQIIAKLAKDNQLFEVQKKPDYKNDFRYRLKVADNDLFRTALNDAHIKHFGSLEMLTGDNFLSVVDVAADTMNELQITTTDKVSISIIPSMIRFSTLLPAKSPNLISRYWSFRWKALQYLKDNNAIMQFELHRDEIYSLESLVEIGLDRIEFTRFYEKLMKIYKKRVMFSTKEEEKKTAATIPELPTQRVEIVKGKMEIELSKNVLDVIAKVNKEKKKNRFPYKLPAGTEWKNFIIQFLNKNEAFIKINRFQHNTDYTEMGFADNRFGTPQPNAGWTFLWVLAKYNGELTIKDPDAKDTYKKQKGLVTEALKSYFGMESDPFYPYQETKSYKTRFTLLPPPEESKGIKHQTPQQKEVQQENIDEEIRQFYEEQATQVYDEKKRGW